MAAMENKPIPTSEVAATVPQATSDGTVPPRTESPAVKLENVPDSTGGGAGGGAINSIGGVTILNNNNGTISNGVTPEPPPGANVAPAATAPIEGNLKAVGPENTAALPPVEKPATAEPQHNDVQGGAAPPVVATKKKKNGKVKIDKKKESGSKEKEKTGLDKLNPF
jgi:outer membrane protein assembly factor BamD